jgi:hypothetical protein
VPLRVRVRQRYRPLLVPATKASQAAAANKLRLPLNCPHFLVNRTIVADPVVVAVRPTMDFLSWVPILLEEDRVCRRDLDAGAAVRVIEDRGHRQCIECPATPSGGTRSTLIPA